MQIRKESDSLGEVDVPADRLWGAQTQCLAGALYGAPLAMPSATGDIEGVIIHGAQGAEPDRPVPRAGRPA